MSSYRPSVHHSQFSAQNCSQRLVTHLGSQRVRSNGDQFETRRATAVGALRSDGFIVEYFVFIGFQPHELETLWTATDLR